MSATDGSSAVARGVAEPTPVSSDGMIRTRLGVRRRVALAATACVLSVATAACGSTAGTPLPTSPTGTAVSAVPSPIGGAPAHVVVAIFENKGIKQVIGSGQAPAFDALAAQGVLYTHSYAITHPSQPNYVALFSGSTQGISNDSCPHTFHTPNLASQLIGSGRTFGGYAEALPHGGYTGCASGNYARKHAPWTDFANVPANLGQPYTAFPTDFTRLPSVAFVVPDLCNDMHNCSIPTGSRWLRDHLDAYASWAQTHHSLLIVTFDEDDSVGPNLVPTIVVGQGIAPARVTDRIDQYTLLRTIEHCFNLAPLGIAAQRTPAPNICR